MTGYLEFLINTELIGLINIFTPSDPLQRGCQLSLSLNYDQLDKSYDIDYITMKLKERNIICDSRKPNVIRIAPTPLYNSYYDVFIFVKEFKSILESIQTI